MSWEWVPELPEYLKAYGIGDREKERRREDDKRDSKKFRKLWQPVI